MFVLYNRSDAAPLKLPASTSTLKFCLHRQVSKQVGRMDGWMGAMWARWMVQKRQVQFTMDGPVQDAQYSAGRMDGAGRVDSTV